MHVQGVTNIKRGWDSSIGLPVWVLIFTPSCCIFPKLHHLLEGEEKMLFTVFDLQCSYLQLEM